MTTQVRGGILLIARMLVFNQVAQVLTIMQLYNMESTSINKGKHDPVGYIVKSKKYVSVWTAGLHFRC